MSKRQGESVRLTLEGIDANGEIMSETVSTWYGFDNQSANDLELAIVAAIETVVRAASDKKGKGRA